MVFKKRALEAPGSFRGVLCMSVNVVNNDSHNAAGWSKYPGAIKQVMDRETQKGNNSAHQVDCTATADACLQKRQAHVTPLDSCSRKSGIIRPLWRRTANSNLRFDP